MWYTLKRKKEIKVGLPSVYVTFVFDPTSLTCIPILIANKKEIISQIDSSFPWCIRLLHYLSFPFLAVSGAGIHIMTIGDHSWSMVGSWKCCGLWTLGPKSLHLHGNLIRDTREYMELGSWEGANKQIEILWVFNTNAWNEVIFSYDFLHV